MIEFTATMKLIVAVHKASEHKPIFRDGIMVIEKETSIIIEARKFAIVTRGKAESMAERAIHKTLQRDITYSL